MSDSEFLYLDLLKKSLTFLLYAPTFLDTQENGQPRIIHPNGSELQHRMEGRDWPGVADTMVGLKRLDNLQCCVEHILARKVPGDFIECGVWRGGASIFLRALLKVYGVTDRRVWLADSFRGLPAPDPDRYPADRGMTLHLADFLAVSREQVKTNFQRYGLLDEQVQFLEGWFRDTLPTLRDHKWSLMRLDGDMYESTMDALINLYPNLSPGGFVVIDDYSDIPACRQAVNDFREQSGIQDEIQLIDWTGAFWQKSESQLQVTVRRQETELQGLRNQLQTVSQEAAALKDTLNTITHSASWQSLQRWRQLRNRLLPTNSRLRRSYERLMDTFRS